MKILINSSRIPACALNIYLGKESVFNGFLFSKENTEIEISNACEQELRFEWSFFIERDDKKSLIMLADCPPWKLRAQAPPKIRKGLNKLFWRKSPNSMEGAYTTIIKGVPDDLERIHLAFRGTKLYKGYALLDISSIEEDKIMQVSFQRRENMSEMIRQTRKWKIKYVMVRIIELCCLFSLGIYLEGSYPIKFLIFLLGIFLVDEMNDMRKTLKDLKVYRNKVREISKFRETPKKVIYNETDD